MLIWCTRWFYPRSASYLLRCGNVLLLSLFVNDVLHVNIKKKNVQATHTHVKSGFEDMKEVEPRAYAGQNTDLHLL